MARPKDSEIEQRLRKVVKHAIKNGQEVTLRSARSKVEEELKLGDGFLKGDEKWKNKSKEIIQGAAANTEETKPSTAAPEPTPPKSKKSSATNTKPKSASKPSSTAVAAKLPSKPSHPPPPKSAAESDSDSSESSDEESRSESEDDASSDSEVEAAKKLTPKEGDSSATQPNGVKRKASSGSESTSSSEESESEEDSSEDEPAQKKAKTSASEASSSEDESEAENKAKADEMELDPPRPSESQSIPKVLTSIPAKAYQPRTGYTALDIATLNANPLFHSSNLAGKELWHITLPSDLPLSSITTLAIDSLQSGTPIITHNGADYILNENSPDQIDASTLLLPTTAGYRRIDQTVTRHLNIQQKIALPNLTVRQADPLTGSSAASNIAQAATKTIPSQPKGLRMRYKPPGFGRGKPGRIGSDSDSSSDSEEETANPKKKKSTLQFPRALGAHATSAQQGTNELLREAAESSSMQANKKKKRKEKKESVVDAAVSASPVVSSDVPVHPRKSTTSVSQSANGSVEETVSKEEKAKRKEERRLKKAAKAAKA